MSTALILFNRDLWVHDNPALSAAAGADRIVPLFVFDDAILGSAFAAPNRVAFMREALQDLDASLEQRGGRLLTRRGDPVFKAATDGGAVHQPWKIASLERGTIDYPEPIVDHADAVVEFRARRGLG